MTPPKFDSFIRRFLDQTLLDNSLIYLDLWSLVHFSSGLLLGLLLKFRYQGKHTWLVALTVLIAYEITELFLNGWLFIPETPLDTFWDLIIGMAGFLITYRKIKKVKSP